MMPFSCYQFSERTRTVQYRTASTETTLNKLENRCARERSDGSLVKIVPCFDGNFGMDDLHSTSSACLVTILVLAILEGFFAAFLG